jgi:hypothetical protein
MEEKAMAEKIVKGKVIHKEGKYFLEVAGKHEVMPVGRLTDEGFLKDIVGKEVEVFYSTPKPFVVAIKWPGRPPITCYFVIDTVLTQPSPELTRSVATKLLNEGFITQEVFEKIIAQ